MRMTRLGQVLRLHRLLGMVLVVFVLGALLTPAVYADPARTGSSPLRASTAACPTPPNGFDILHASLDQLHYYGLPRPPEGSAQERAAWVKDFEAMRFSQRICGDGIVSTQVHPQTLQQKQLTNGPLVTNNYLKNYHWSGYYATNGGFTRTIAKWYVPTRYSSPSPNTAAQWVGIGGVSGSNLWQAGTTTDYTQGYRMWWEAYPNPVHYAGPAISPGNEIYINVDYNWTYAGKSYVYMYNYSNGQLYSTVQSFTPDTHTADWIVERTGDQNCSVTYLTKTSQVQWHGAFAQSTAAGGNTLQNINYYSNTEVDMAEGNTYLETTSVLGTGSDGGSTFNSTFSSNGTYCY